MHDLIFISLENWDDIWRRNQFVCAALARRHPDMRILFAGIPRNMSQILRRARFADLLERSAPLPDYPSITFTRPPGLVPESFEWGFKLNERIFRRHIQKLSAGFRDPILWINSHWAYHLVPHLPHAALIYDITDDWLTSTQPELDRRRTLHADSFLCKNAQATIVCSPKLFQLKRNLVANDRLHLIPNGVDADHYATIPDRSRPIAPEVANLPRPVLGYTGTLHEDRLDLDLLLQLARQITGSIALVGPSHLNHAQVHALQTTGKVHLVPPVAYQKIPEIMRGFDVCITPHRVTPFTESLNPIKLWEYLASGKPIVSTPVAGFRDFPEFVYTADTASSFAVAVGKALAEAPNMQAQRQAEARKHSWNARVDQIEAVMKDALNPRQPVRQPQPEVKIAR